MTTRRANKAQALATAMAEEDHDEQQRLLAQRDDSWDKIAALKAMRETQSLRIQASAAEQVAATRTLFAELIDSEQRRIDDTARLLRELDDDDGASGDPADTGVVTSMKRSKLQSG